jgi:hypothetical protein
MFIYFYVCDTFLLAYIRALQVRMKINIIYNYKIKLNVICAIDIAISITNIN